MTVPLSEMSRDALVRELRIASASWQLRRVEQIKYWLVKKNTGRDLRDDVPQVPAKHWQDIDD